MRRLVGCAHFRMLCDDHQGLLDGVGKANGRIDVIAGNALHVGQEFDLGPGAPANRVSLHPRFFLAILRA